MDNPAIQGVLRSCSHCDLSLQHAGPVLGQCRPEPPAPRLVDDDARGVLMPRRPTDGQGGQAIVVMAAIIIILVIFGALVFDLGLAMSDRRNLQAYADASALAGARSYTPASVAGAHWVAMQYLTGPLGFALPTGSCTNSANCPAGTYTVSPFTIDR